MTTLLEHSRIALASLRANWFRAALTALGVVIGVASLVAVTAVSAGAQKEVADSIRRLGGNVIKVDGEFITIGTAVGQRPDDHAAGHRRAGTAPGGHGGLASPERSRASSSQPAAIRRTRGSRESRRRTPMSRTRRWSEGRLISDADVSFGRSVMVVGLDAEDRLFPGESAIGKTVRVGSSGVRGGRCPGPKRCARRREPRQPDFRPTPHRDSGHCWEAPTSSTSTSA